MNTMLLSASLAIAALGQPSGGGVTVAVVDVPAVSEQFQGTKDLEAAFEQRRVQFNQEREALREKIDKTRRSLQEELKPGTAEFEARRKELMMLEAELQWFNESKGQEIEGGLADSLHRIYNDIHAAVAEVAEANNIHIVLAADRLPPESPPTTQQARQQILLQKTLYWSPSVDITAAVVAHLNEKYKAAQEANKGGSGAAKPPQADADAGS